MKRNLCVLCLFVCITTNAAVVWDGTSVSWTKGSGTEADPYLIETPSNLKYLADRVNKGNTYAGSYFLQTEDLDLNKTSWPIIGTYSKNKFSGNYDGGTHQILNVTNYLFGYVIYATIKNLTIAGASTFPIINAVQDRSVLVNCFNKSTVNLVSSTAGIAQTVSGEGGRFTNCGNYANIKYTTKESIRVGGCFGLMSGSQAVIKQCFNLGTIEVSCGTAVYLGGIIGEITGSDNTMECCYNQGTIRVNLTDYSMPSWRVGGLIGSISSKGSVVSYSYSTGNITVILKYGGCSNPYAGSLIGVGSNSTVRGCYVVENWIYDTTSDRMPAAIGYSLKSIERCYCPIDYVIQQYANNDVVYPLPLSEMRESPFVSSLNTDGDYFCMDYTNINNGYPILRWQLGDTPFYTIRGICKAEQGTVSGAGEYPQGAQVKLTATPKDNYTFVGWSDGNTDNPRTISVDKAATYVAQFDRLSYTVYVNQDCSITVE